MEVDFLIEKLGNGNKKCVYGGRGRVHTLSAPGMQRRENEILESKVQIEITKFKTKMIIRKPSQDELRSTVRAFIKKAGYVIKTCYNGKNNICVMDKYYTNCQFLSKRSMQWPLKEVVYVDSSGQFHIRQTAKLSYVMPESFYK